MTELMKRYEAEKEKKESSMRKLGEQWVEEIDGKKHMLKAVESFELCQGCLFNCNQGGCCWKGFDSCHMGHYFIIKDLGVLNEQGCLPAPWDKNLYPNIDNCIIDGKDTGWDIYVDCFNIEMVVNAKTFKQAIDLWNRRTQ